LLGLGGTKSKWPPNEEEQGKENKTFKLGGMEDREELEEEELELELI